ncbi:MAG TPA: class I SAM-dependent methyltransferase [Bacteroidota bacterium]|nr:class I SAM-dependent methyltransferase [Bacteroidota bacterium]
MDLWNHVVEIFGRPTGIPGKIAGLIMANRPSNLERNSWALSLLKIQPTDRVLEVGFGPGVAIRRSSELATKGMVWGIDHSVVMFRQAYKRNQKAIGQGRVKLFLGTTTNVPPMVGPIDKVFSVNVYQFWNSPEENLKELYSRMAPGGKIAVAYQPRTPGSKNSDAVKAGEAIARSLEQSGFENIKVEKKDMKPVQTVCALGTKPLSHEGRSGVAVLSL